jgi:hypothetical protein
VWKSASRAGPVGDASLAGEHGFGPRTNGKAEAMAFAAETREGCQYPDPSRRSLVLVDETAQEVSAPEVHR